MSDNVYKSIEITGTSTEGLDDAIRKGVARAAQTVRELDWFEVSQIRGHIENGSVEHVQVTMKIGFRLE
jgi:flavin-binding protein dodecin